MSVVSNVQQDLQSAFTTIQEGFGSIRKCQRELTAHGYSAAVVHEHRRLDELCFTVQQALSAIDAHSQAAACLEKRVISNLEFFRDDIANLGISIENAAKNQKAALPVLDDDLVSPKATALSETHRLELVSFMPSYTPGDDLLHFESLECLVDNLHSKRMQFAPVLLMDVNDFPSFTTRVALDPMKKIYPVCENGGVRSQMTYHVLRGMGYMNVQPPHGAIAGVDPFVLPPVSLQRAMLNIEKSKNPKEIFRKANQYPHFVPSPRGCIPHLGYPYVRRMGEEPGVGLLMQIFYPYNCSSYRIDPKFAQKFDTQKKKMDAHFDTILREGGEIIAFDRSFHTMLFRLGERAGELGVDDFRHIRIIPIYCLGNPTATKQTTAFSRTAIGTLFGEFDKIGKA